MIVPKFWAEGRLQQIAVYVPTTQGVDQPADTTVYTERTLAFLGER